MGGLNLDQADWDKERGAIEQEVSRDLSSPIYTYLSQLQAIMFAGTPYENDALGTRPSFDKTDAKLLRAFYERWYAPNNAILVIAGDVDPAAAIAQARTAFGGIPRRDIPAHATFTRTSRGAEDADAANGLSGGAGDPGLPHARPEGSRFRGGRYIGRCAGQRARRAVHHGHVRTRLAVPIRVPAQSRCGVCAGGGGHFRKGRTPRRCWPKCAAYSPRLPRRACRRSWWRRRGGRNWRSWRSRMTASPAWRSPGPTRWRSATRIRRTTWPPNIRP